MKNPFLMYFWILGQDVLNGDLTRQGYRAYDHPRAIGSRVYSNGCLHLHSMGLRLDTPEGSLIYDRTRQSFYLGPICESLPPLQSLQEFQRLTVAEGWKRVYSYFLDYENTIRNWRGSDYRRRQCRACPPLLRSQRRWFLEAQARFWAASSTNQEQEQRTLLPLKRRLLK